MKKLFKKIKAFLLESNHYWHVIGGFAVGLFAFDCWMAIFVALIAASCLEFKDREYGNRWDWTDWLLTVGGALPPALLWLLAG